MSGHNRDAEPIEVYHADLKRASDESPYRSKCPVAGCDGVLLVSRDHTFDLKAHDCCISCAQPVIYLDIKRMRRELG